MGANALRLSITAARVGASLDGLAIVRRSAAELRHMQVDRRLARWRLLVLFALFDAAPRFLDLGGAPGLKRPFFGVISASSFRVGFEKLGDGAIAMVSGHCWQHLSGSGLSFFDQSGHRSGEKRS